MKKKILVGLITAGALLTLAACGSSNGSSSSSSSSSDKALSGKIIAGGSTALQPLAQQSSTEFMAKNPSVQVTVQGGGSGSSSKTKASPNESTIQRNCFPENSSNEKMLASSKS